MTMKKYAGGRAYGALQSSTLKSQKIKGPLLRSQGTALLSLYFPFCFVRSSRRRVTRPTGQMSDAGNRKRSPVHRIMNRPLRSFGGRMDTLGESAVRDLFLLARWGSARGLICVSKV